MLIAQGPSQLMLVWLTSISLRGAVVVALATIVCLSLRKRPAALRHAVWCAALAVFALLPAAVQLIPSWHVRVLRASAFATAASPAARPEIASARVAAATDLPAARPSRSVDPRAVAVIAWLAIAAGLLSRLLTSHLRLASLVRRSRALDGTRWTNAMADAARAVGLQRPVPLHTSDELSLPIAVGLVRPRVVLPRHCDAWNGGTLHKILLHELAHVRRHDLAWLTLGRLLAACFWFHPFVWFACARLRAAAEASRDDVVLRSGERASDYASLLLELAAAGARPAPIAGLAVLTREHLSERIEGIIAPRRARHGASRQAIAAVACGAWLVAGLVAAPSLESARAGDRDERRALQVHPGRDLPLHALGATVRSRSLANGRTRLDTPEIDVENTGGRAIRSVELRLETPGVSEDRIWSDQIIAPGERTVVRVPTERWSQEVPRSKASRFEIGITAVRFMDEPGAPAKTTTETPAPGAPPAPKAAPAPGKYRSAPSPPAAPSTGVYTPAPAPKATSEDERLYRGDGPRVQAAVWNPPDAPVVIGDAWVPRDPPPPSESEAERDMDRGRDITWQPGLALHNTTGRRVVGLRLRFKADTESHAVTGLAESIEPDQWVFLLPRRSMRGKPEAMMVQVLGVRFADGSTWGSLSSTIDTRQGWIR